VKVSIVIPAHNSAATLGECLTACLKQTYPDCEIIVVDDGSTDNTAGVAQAFPVTLVRQARRGPAAARNTGANAATGVVVAFTDSDCIAHGDWIERLIAGFTGDIRAVGGTYGIANPHSALARLIHAEIQLRHARYGDQVDFAGSYNMAVEREAFLELNGFDEDFRSASAEDNDLCYRLLDSGRGIRFVREAIVDHYHPVRLRPYLVTQARHGFWRAKLYAKHPGRKSGDRYAGGLELWLPVVAIVLVANALILMLFLNLPLLIACAGGLLLLFFYRVNTAWQITRADNSMPLLYSAWTLWLRDFARGIGIARGVWHFLILRRVTA